MAPAKIAASLAWMRTAFPKEACAFAMAELGAK
jgi:hypothetical protein